YQLLVGDVSRELHPGWAKELSLRFGVPKGHLELIDCCVGWFDERPKNASELLKLIRGLREEPAKPAPAPAPAPPPLPAAPTTRPAAATTQIAQPADQLRQSVLEALVRQLHAAHEDLAVQEQRLWTFLGPALVVGFIVLIAAIESHAPVFPALLMAALAGG